MGGRKFRLSKHRKNEERKRKWAKSHESTLPASLTISLKLETYIDGNVQSSESLYTRISSLSSLPSSWIIASTNPLTLCKLRIQEEQTRGARITATLSLTSDLEWTLVFLDKEISSNLCPLLHELPSKLTSVAVVHRMMLLIDSAKVCVGNPDAQFVELLRHRLLTIHGSSSE